MVIAVFDLFVMPIKFVHYTSRVCIPLARFMYLSARKIPINYLPCMTFGIYVYIGNCLYNTLAFAQVDERTKLRTNIHHYTYNSPFSISFSSIWWVGKGEGLFCMQKGNAGSIRIFSPHSFYHCCVFIQKHFTVCKILAVPCRVYTN